jgi:hypothetical protein
MDQKERILASERAFIVQINHAKRDTLTHRYQVYVLFKNMLMPLFFLKKDNRLKFQVTCPENRYFPRFHFAIKGSELENIRRIREALIEINPKIKVHFLNGH